MVTGFPIANKGGMLVLNTRLCWFYLKDLTCDLLDHFNKVKKNEALAYMSCNMRVVKVGIVLQIPQ